MLHADVFGITVDQINALSQIGLTGGALLTIFLFIIGKITAGFLLDRAEARADKLQTALDAAATVNAKFPEVIADLNATHAAEVEKLNQSHEREVGALAIELRRLQDMIAPRK